MPHEINLSHLRVTYNCFDVSRGWLWRLHFLGKWPHLTCRKLLQINIGIIYGFGEKPLILQKKKQNISLCKIFAVSDGYFARDTWAWAALYHSLKDLFPCLKLVSRSNLALTSFVCGLRKSSYLDHITPKLKSSLGKYMTHIDPFQNLHSMLWPSCISLLQVT